MASAARKFVGDNIESVTRQQRCSALRTERGFSLVVSGVARVDEATALLNGNLPCTVECCGRSLRDVGQFVHRPEPGEVKGHIGSEFLYDPFGHAFGFVGAVVERWNDEDDDLVPDAGLRQAFQGVQHGLQLA